MKSIVEDSSDFEVAHIELPWSDGLALSAQRHTLSSSSNRAILFVRTHSIVHSTMLVAATSTAVVVEFLHLWELDDVEGVFVMEKYCEFTWTTEHE